MQSKLRYYIRPKGLGLGWRSNVAGNGLAAIVHQFDTEKASDDNGRRHSH